MPEPAEPRPSSRAQALVVFAAVLLAVLMRIPVLLTDPLWGTTEQHEFGLFPAHLVAGLLGPPSIYMPQVHQGCTILFGLLCAPAMAVFGPTLLAMRVCSLLLHAAIVGSVVWGALRAAGWRGALAASLLGALAPPTLQHYAVKGSTNHDDATLFVVLALIAGAASARRPLRGGAVAGLLAGLSVAYYLDALFAVAAVAGAMLLVIPTDRLRRATGLLLGGVASMVLTAPLGVRPLQSPAVREALFRSPLAGASDLPPLGERLGELLERGALGALSIPGVLEFGPLQIPGGAGAALLYLLALVVMASVGWWASREVDVERRVLRGGAAAAGVLTVLAVGASGVDPGYGGYLAPAWTYALLAAGAGGGRRGWTVASTPPRDVGAARRALRVERIGGAVFGVAAGIALLVALGAGPLHPWRHLQDRDLVAQATLANRLTAARLHRHSVATRAVLPRSDQEIQMLESERPGERMGLRRIRGWQVALGARNPATVEEVVTRLTRAAAVDGGEVDRWEGVGEGLVRALRLVPRIDRAPRKVEALAQEIVALEVPGAPAGSEEERRWRLGALDEILGYASGEFDAVSLLWQTPGWRAVACRAVGRWGYLGRRPHRVHEWNDARGRCTRPELAAGWGEALARDLVPVGVAPESPPRLSWFWAENDPAAEQALVAGFVAEAARLRGVSGGR